MDDSQIFIIGAKGQLGTALLNQFPGAQSADIDELDMTNKKSVSSYDWSKIKILINAAAYTNVDGAETAEGRVDAWNVNALAVANLAEVARKNNMVFVHISTDYVFDGTKTPHSEDELFSPLSVYGASKAAGDIIAATVNRHYILRTSWVIGEGKNFVRTMLELGRKGVNPTVVSDQIGRLTFTSELVRAITHLLERGAEYGTYNLSNDGEPASWADITRIIFKEAGLNNTVSDTSTDKYFEGKTGIAPRPLKSTLDLKKIQTTGFRPRDWKEDLTEYIKKELG